MASVDVDDASDAFYAQRFGDSAAEAGDGFVDANELAELLANWGSGLSSIEQLNASTIPEPTTLMLLALGSVVAGRRRCDRRSGSRTW